MALRPCPECKSDVSTDAKTCPRCGKDLGAKADAGAQLGVRIMLAILLVGAIFLALYVFGCPFVVRLP